MKKKVLFIQGINFNQKRSDFIEKYFTDMGYEVVILECSYSYKEVDKIKLFIKKINQVVKGFKGHDTILVAHSFGGIIASSLDLISLEKFKKIIFVTAANRHNRFGIEKVKKEINYRDIAKLPDFTDKIYSIGVYFDHLIFFLFSKLTHNHKNFLHYHNSIYRTKKIWDKISKFVNL